MHADNRARLADFNRTTRPYPKERGVHALFEEQAARRPQAPALVDGDSVLTYQELNERANRLAHFLIARGLEPGRPVALCMDRSCEFVVAVLGLLKAGAAYAPFSPNLPPQRLRTILEDIGTPLMLTHRGRVEQPPIDGLSIIHVDREAAAIASFPDANPSLPHSPGALAYVMFTSGSTGKPKGVEIPHRAILRLVFNTDFLPFNENQVFLLLAPVSFDASTLELWGALLHGARCVVYPDESLDFHELGRVLRESRVSCLWLTAALFNTVIDIEPELLACVPNVMTGGEALSVPHVRRALQYLPSTQLVNGYGPTESTTFTCTYPIPRDFPAGARSVPIGKPIANTRVYILDEAGNPVSVDEPGELFIGGDGLALGYRNRPELTAERFLPDPFSEDPNARMYKTGDRCRWLPDGTVDFLGRLDDQVKLRGFRIELGEIEHVLGRHPSVRQCAVVVRGEGNAKRLIAYVVLRASARSSAAELAAHLAEHLPEYMIPSALEFLDALPISAVGKVDRRALPEPAPVAETGPREYVAPSSALERMLAGIWAGVLKLERVGVEDNFFELGGESLKVAAVLARISEATGIRLAHRRLFEMPTIRQLARYVEGQPENTEEVAHPKIERRPHDAITPLSFGQEEIWFTAQVHQGTSLFNEPFSIHMKEPVDVPALEKALNALTERHEALRTSFQLRKGVPVAILHEGITISLQVVDLRTLPVQDREPEAVRRAEDETRRPFDLQRPPLARALLAQFAEDDFCLYLIMHHIITDAYSWYHVLIPELRTFYEAFRANRAPGLPELPLQFSDYACWQREQEGPLAERHLQSWKERFADAEQLALVADHARPSPPSCRGAFEVETVSPELTDALRTLSLRERVTLFMTLLAGFKAVLARYTLQDEIVIGTAVDGRDHPELERLLGCFVTTVPIRTRVDGSPSFRELLHRVRDATLTTYEQKALPFSLLSRELELSGNPYRHPMFQVACLMEPPPPVYPFNWSASQVEVQSGSVKFDLLVGFEERDGGLEVRLERSTGLFDHATVKRMFAHFVRLMEAAAANPGIGIHEVTLLDPAERARILHEFSCVERPYPRDAAIHTLFERQAARRPGAVAVVDGDCSATYGELNARANRLAHELLSRGVRGNVPVIVCMDRSLDFVIAVLAVLKAGGAYVPLDPALAPQRIQQRDDIGASIVLTHRGYTREFESSGMDTVELDSGSALLQSRSDSNPPVTVAGDGLACLMFTSGSSDKPNCVEILHRGVVRLVCGTDYVPFDESQVFLLLANVGFDASTFELWGPLLHGGRLVIYPHSAPHPALDLAELERVIASSGVTCLLLTTAHFNHIIDVRPQTLTPLRHLLIGGEALSVAHIRQALEQFPQAQLINVYGPTAGATFTCAYSIPRALPGDVRSIPIGRPIPNTRVYILDALNEPVPIGVPGELHVGGDGLARGYRNRPEQTAARFVPNPFSTESGDRLYRTGDRLYRTGDRCRWLPGGPIEFLGRFDRQVTIRGFRIELTEIEAALANHSSVNQCAVVARDDTHGKQLTAYVTPTVGARPSASMLRGYLSGLLPDYMVPSHIVFMDAMPLTPNGKLDRNALPAPVDFQGAYVAPRTATEHLLAAIWQETFQREHISVEDSFFDLGGHSLLALSLFAKLEKKLGRRLSLAHIFTAPTIAELAALLDDTSRVEAAGKAILLEGSGSRSPVFCIPGVGGTVFSFRKIASVLGAQRPFYGLQYPGLAENETPMDTLEDVADELIRRMLDVKPHGPYCLLGYSLGGLVAYEMAVRLAKRGHRVAMLGLLDASTPAATEKRPLPQRFAVHARLLAQRGLLDKLRYAIDLMKRSRAKAQKAAPPAPTHENAEVVERVKSVKRHMNAAAYRYVPGPYPGKLVLFRAEQPDWMQFTFMDDLMGWEPLAQNGVEVHSIPGEHLKIFDEPNVDELIRVLQACLTDVDRNERA